MQGICLHVAQESKTKQAVHSSTCPYNNITSSGSRNYHSHSQRQIPIPSLLCITFTITFRYLPISLTHKLVTMFLIPIANKGGFGHTMSQGALKTTKSPARRFDIRTGKMRESRVQNIHQNNGGAVEAGASLVGKDFASSIKAATEVPPSSFEFCAWSDVGINLHVDLNLSPSDWTNRFKSEVCISEFVHGNKSQSLRQSLSGLGENYIQGKTSFLWSTNSGQIDDHDGQAKSSPILKLTEDGAAELDQQNKDVSPLICDSLTPCNVTVKMADNLQENHSAVSAEVTVNAVDNLLQDQSTASAEVSYGVLNNFISGAESCAEDAPKKILDSEATDMPFIKSFCESVVNSLLDPGTSVLQNSKLDNERSGECSLLNGSCLVNPSVVCVGASLSSSVELQNSEVISCHKYASVSLCDNDGVLEQDELINSTEINFETGRNNFTSQAEEWVPSQNQLAMVGVAQQVYDEAGDVGLPGPAGFVGGGVLEVPHCLPHNISHGLNTCWATPTIANWFSRAFFLVLMGQELPFRYKGYALRRKRLETSKVVDRRESSECSQFDDSLKKSSLDFNDQDSKTELHKKRKNRDSKTQGSSVKPTTTRVLRSMMVLPRRRSMRLISKVL
ncbi:hypothetical protein RJT34_30160 [Clitoria ternatea]|uniref:Uncharacterized protein n=1 Tax=Clitoria ternatea TaxID=43366 RepID=A0AAN9I735_CLITE